MLLLSLCVLSRFGTKYLMAAPSCSRTRQLAFISLSYSSIALSFLLVLRKLPRILLPSNELSLSVFMRTISLSTGCTHSSLSISE